MRNQACLIVLLLAHFIVYGQTTPQHSSQVTGTITADGQPVIAATVTLLTARDSSLEAGIKSSYVKTDNDAHYEHLINEQHSFDNNLSNHFIYKENINAAYLAVNKKISSTWETKLGLRVENTNSEGDQLTSSQTFERHYTQLFPTAYVGYQANSKNQFSVSYGRRIERPNYQDMNPFLYFLDKYTYHAGNSFLKPQFSHNIGLTHTYAGVPTSSLSYTRTTDIIEVINQIDSTKIAYTYDNLATSNVVTASIGLNMPLTE